PPEGRNPTGETRLSVERTRLQLRDATLWRRDGCAGRPTILVVCRDSGAYNLPAKNRANCAAASFICGSAKFQGEPMSAHLRMRACSVIALSAVLLVFGRSTLQAAVRDEAGFFGADAVGKANARIAEIEKHGPELHIETVDRPSQKAGDVSQMSKAER